MFLSESLSTSIVTTACTYLNHPFDYEKFNCVHFVISVYENVGISVPRLSRNGYPLTDFHLFSDEFAVMPIGHSVFFKRKTKVSTRIWSHVAIVVSPYELIHCSRYFGGKVVITPKEDFLGVYDLVPK